MTRLIRSLYNIRPSLLHGVLTIGNFDGVHLGHQQLLANVVKESHARGVASTVMTFEPHPFEFFNQEKVTTPRLTRLREKFSALRDLGVDNVIIIQFNQSFASLSASDFVDLLTSHIKPQHVVIGDDFHFGKKRQGDVALLTEMGRTRGFTVEALTTFVVDNERVSSTRVRQALATGDQDLARKLLGHPYTMMGRIRPGDQLGRKLGFPTANIFIHRPLTAVHGIYVVKMHGLNEQPLPGVANVGIRPTINGTRTLLEVHLLDFAQDIYGRYVQVEFMQKLRDEERYPDLDSLKAQIAADVADGRAYFSNQNRNQHEQQTEFA